MVKTKKTKKTAKTTTKEKLVGKIEHIFEKIQVVTTTLKNPLKVGDIVRIKGHTTNIVQEIKSIQIEHESVQKAKKGDGVGIKIAGTVRDNDMVYFADKKTIIAFRHGALTPVPLKQTFVSQPKILPILRRAPAIAAQRPVVPQKGLSPAAKDRPEQPKFFSF